MTTHSNFPDHDETQWLAQERARQAERQGDTDVDAEDLRVARALRHAPPVELPVDFAAQMAGLAGAQAVVNLQFEQHLLRGLSVLFGISAVLSVAWFGRSWPADLAAALPGGSEAVSWSAAAALCVLGNWAFALMRHSRNGRGHPPA